MDISARDTSTCVTERPAFLYANVWTGGDKKALAVYVSPAVRQDDPWLRPIHDVLESTCYVPGTSVVVEDPSMMFGEAVYSVHELMAVCPGQGVEHTCCVVRERSAA